MSQQDWATFDSQANKENIPFPHISHLKPGVISGVIPDVSTLASLSEKDVLLPEIEVDVVTVTQSSVPSPSLSQGSNISEHSQGSCFLFYFNLYLFIINTNIILLQAFLDIGIFIKIA
uniref:Ovule protein n=1 Tax=Heterorhabditis bacteriophora TaxID=37862 RepID=A0A1I7WJB7_HETBA